MTGGPKPFEKEEWEQRDRILGLDKGRDWSLLQYKEVRQNQRTYRPGNERDWNPLHRGSQKTQNKYPKPHRTDLLPTQPFPTLYSCPSRCLRGVTSDRSVSSSLPRVTVVGVRPTPTPYTHTQEALVRLDQEHLMSKLDEDGNSV